MNIKKTGILLFATLLMVPFQNCSGVNFNPEDATAEKGINYSQGEPEGTDEGDGSGNIVDIGSDPFDTGTAICQKFNRVAVGQKIVLDGVTELVYKDGHDGGEIIGFKVTANGVGLSYLIKAGGEGFYDKDLAWVHPEGMSGPEASAISHITFCIGDTSNGIPDPSLGNKQNPSLASAN